MYNMSVSAVFMLTVAREPVPNCKNRDCLNLKYKEKYRLIATVLEFTIILTQMVEI